MEWETVENMKVHYKNVERHMLAVGIAEANPHSDPESKAADVNDMDHQRILIKESERHCVHSFNKAGWSPDLMDAGNIDLRVVIGVDLGYSHVQHVLLNILVVHFHVLNRLLLHSVALVVAWICELKPVLV